MLEVMFSLFNKIMMLPFVTGQLAGEIGDSVDDIANSDITATGSGVDALASFISQIIGIALPVAVLCLLLLLGYGGILMTTSQGNPEKLNEAKDVITNALIGFVVIVSAGVILIVANNVLNLGITY